MESGLRNRLGVTSQCEGRVVSVALDIEHVLGRSTRLERIWQVLKVM